MKTWSFRRLNIEYGFNIRHIKSLLNTGALCEVTSGRVRSVTDESVATLREGMHFIVCRACGARQAMLSPKHLWSCSRLNITEYLERYPDSELLCAFTRQNKAKTDAQKQAQSEKLTRRFTTPEGQVTRAQISAASKITAIAEKDARVQRLRKAWEDPQFRLKQAALTKARWESGNLRDAVVRWHRENKELSNTIIANARKCDNPGENLRKARLIQVKTSKLHLAFKVRMLTAGLNSFITESQLGPFRIDEARHDIKVAVEIDGCWWHGCQRCGFTGVRATVANDKSKNAYIATIGWALVRIRECDIKADPDACIAHIRSVIDSATQKGTTC